MLWLVALMVIFILFWALVADYQQKQSRTIKEYEEDIQNQGISGQMVKIGFLELDRFMKPDLKAAIEYVKDENQGQTKHKKEDEDPEEELRIEN